MDLQKIEQLVEKYFEGETSLEEERELHHYFSKNEVAPHLEVYKGMFNYFAEAKKEKTDREVVLQKTNTNGPGFKMRSWYSIAALFIVALGVAFFFNNNSNTVKLQQEQEALAAFEATKVALDFISVHFNESTKDMTYLHEFGDTTNKLFK